MKEKYEKPSVELDEFETQDVLTTSGDTTPAWGAEETPFI